MKESIGVLSLTNIVIVFILLFTGYLCISLNQTKAYNVKSRIINIVQEHNGIGPDARAEIKEYMNQVGYRSTGKCDVDTNVDNASYFAIDSSGNMTENAEKGMICITRHTTGADTDNGQFPKAAYYDVKVFFALDLPIINTIFNFNLKGNSRVVFCPTEDGGCK